MRFVIPFLGFEMPAEQGEISSIAIENPDDFRLVAEDLWRQKNGMPGGLILSEQEKSLNFRDGTLCVFNPLDIDANDRKVLNHLYKELNENALELLTSETSYLQGELLTYLDKLAETVPYDLTYNFDLCISDLLKSYAVRVNQLNESYLDRLIDYLRAYSRICNTKTVFMINLKNYISEEQAVSLREFIQYENMTLITLENMFSYSIFKENAWIIDKERCIISLN